MNKNNFQQNYKNRKEEEVWNVNDMLDGAVPEKRPSPVIEKKKEIPPQIHNLDEELKKMGFGLFLVGERKDKNGCSVKTKNGKVARIFYPYRVTVFRVAKNDNGCCLQWLDNKCEENMYRELGITEKEYNSFLKTASVKKRIKILTKNWRTCVVRKIRHDRRIMLRLSEEDYRLLQELAGKMGKRKVSELIRNRIRGTIVHEALTAEEKQDISTLVKLETDLRQYGNTIRNYLKTTGAKGVQRLDVLFNSQPGTDYAKVIFEAAKRINRTIKSLKNDN